MENQLQSIREFNPLKAIAIPNVGQIEPKGLNLVIGPNSSGKTQLLRDIHARMLGKNRRLVVCDDISIERADSIQPLLDALIAESHVRKTVGADGGIHYETLLPDYGGGASRWKLSDGMVKHHFSRRIQSGSSVRDGVSDKFLEHFGRSFVMALFLDRRLTITNEVRSFDYENEPPANELQALYVNTQAKQMLADEARNIFGKSIWLDNTRANILCLRIGNGPDLPSAADRLEPSEMREYRCIEDEGDGFKSYMAICLTLLLGQRPVVLIDEPEMCLHPPQAYALGRFIGKHAVSTDRTTFVATHSSQVLRGIIEETDQLEVIRLSRNNNNFVGRSVSKEVLRSSIEKPSTKSENILDGLFAEAVTIVESEGDRLVYGTAWDKIANDFNHDVHFVSVGGLGGVADPCKLYKSLKIPVCVAIDLDIIRETGTLKQILNSIAPREISNELVKLSIELVDQVKALGPISSAGDTRNILNSILNESLDWQDTEQLKRIRTTLSKLTHDLSQTARLKNGLQLLQDSPVFHDVKAFINKCNAVGLFLVPVGELEDWIAGLVGSGPSKTKKAEWANYAAEKIRESPSQDLDVCQYIRRIACFQRDDRARLAGYSDQ